jgi:hypothetical protein
MTYREPRARVVAVDVDDRTSRITIELDCAPWRLLAPASLCRDDDPSVRLVTLERLVQLEGVRGSFEPSEPIPAELFAGLIVVFRSWWDPDQLAIARGGRSWERRRFLPTNSIRYRPDGSDERVAGGWDHEHCRLCWETFDEETPFGYVSGDDWLCGKCYDDYIASGFGARLGDEV